MTKPESEMFVALISFAIFSLAYYALWKLWCKFSPSLISDGAPEFIKKPPFLLFFAVTIIFVLIYKNASKNN